jgi:hypothetical protein
MSRDDEKKKLKAQRRQLVKELRKVHDKLARGENFYGNVVAILNALIFLHELREKLK